MSSFKPLAAAATDPISFLGIDKDHWDLIATVATTIGFAFGAVAVVIALRQYQQAQRIHREQTRPYMVITAEPSPASMTFVDLVIRNLGTTPAYDLEIEVTPRLERAREDMGFEIAEARVFNDRISMWAPGYEFRQYFDSHIERQGVQQAREKAGEEPLPNTFTATLSYYGSPADRRGRREVPWVEKQVIDVEIGKGTVYTEIYGLHHAAKALREIETLVKKAKLDGPREVVVEGRNERNARLHSEREAWEAKIAAREEHYRNDTDQERNGHAVDTDGYDEGP
jgi:hypothetical protein